MVSEGGNSGATAGNCPTPTGIFSHHLQRQMITLDEQPELASVLDAVMSATEPVRLAPILAYKLSCMGLIKQSGDKTIPGCELYRQYFEHQS